MRLAPSTLGGELLVAWMKRENVSQRELARYLEWSLARVHRILTGSSELSVGEAIQIEDLTKGEVSPRSWTYEPSGKVFGSQAHEKISHRKGAH